MIFTSLIPDYYTNQLMAVDWNYFYEKGFRFCFLDIDNTLEPDGSRVPSNRSKTILTEIRKGGLTPILFSNAKPERASQFASHLDPNLSYLGLAGKPLPGKLRRWVQEHQVGEDEILIVGDQILTDIWCGKLAGVRTFFSEPCGPENHSFVRLKRKIERWIRIWGGEPRQAQAAPLHPDNG